DVVLARLLRAAPSARLAQDRLRCASLTERLENAVRRQLTNHKGRLALAARALDNLSPLATLQRGYAIVTRADAGEAGGVVYDAAALSPGERIRARFHQGSIDAVVDSITTDTSPGTADDGSEKESS
ncbi:MAG: exodeoxyribonuclease VII large subunit, partial [Pseudomonadota bacterium]